MIYTFTGNRLEEIHVFIDDLFKRTDETVAQRNDNANSLIESYYERFEEVPPSSALERLGSYIMRDDYEDKSPDKVTKTEYPTLSEDQQKRRGRREFPNDNIDSYSRSEIGRRTSQQIDDGTKEWKPVQIGILDQSVPNTTRLPLY